MYKMYKQSSFFFIMGFFIKKKERNQLDTVFYGNYDKWNEVFYENSKEFDGMQISKRVFETLIEFTFFNPFYKDVFYEMEDGYKHVIFLIIAGVLSNLLFKLTAAPFHFWAPIVYGSSPLPTVTILTIISKAAVIILFWIIIDFCFISYKFLWQNPMFSIALISVITSILGALTENNLKKFFIFSSISHVGFLIINVAVSSLLSKIALLDYLILYILSSLIIWIVLMILTKKTSDIINLKGFSYNFKYLCFIFVITLFSMGGLPPFGGFYVKFAVFNSLINASFFNISYFLFILTIFNFSYYLRLIKIIYFEDTFFFQIIKGFFDIKKSLVSSLIFLIPCYFIIFGDTWNFTLTNIIFTIY